MEKNHVLEHSCLSFMPPRSPDKDLYDLEAVAIDEGTDLDDLV